MSDRNRKETVKGPGSGRKLLLIAAVTALVVFAAVLMDRTIRNPPCRDETDALNVVTQKVLPTVKEIAGDEGYALDAGERETIGERDYYPVAVSRVVRCRDGEAAKEVVRVRVAPHLAGVGPYVYDFMGEVTREGELYYEVKFGDSHGDARSTIYVRAKDSKPFIRWEDGTISAAFPEKDEPPVLTVYVRTRDSRPFLRDGTSGRLVPYGE